MNSPHAYRADIDGLRAIAVLSVVLFHAKIDGFSGGYIGVDIFFVISGFLITTILLRELKSDKFSLAQFWARRIKRIFPALTTVLIATTAAGYYIFLFQSDIVDLGKSLFAQSLFLSNIFFLRKSDYFSDGAEISPLLHTWTLSVEEQFYIFFPIILFVIFNFFRKHLTLTLLILTFASFAYSVYLAQISPGDSFLLPFLPHIWGSATHESAGFYLLFSRAWELLLGVLIPVMAIAIRSYVAAEITSALGLLAIVSAVLGLNESVSFPGITALVPTLACCAIIVANERHHTTVRTILSYPIIVGIGLISYSLYLWHWPIFVFSEVLIFEKTFLTKILLIALSLTLAIITYFLVELPFKKKKLALARMSPIHTITTGLFIMILFAFLGVCLTKIDTSSRTPVSAQAISEAAVDISELMQRCHTEKTILDYEKNGPCIIGSSDPDLVPSFVIWGDSHAASVIDAIHNSADQHHMKGLFISGDACIPLTDVFNKPSKESCEKLQKLAITYILRDQVRQVFLIAKWNTYTTFYPELGTKYLLVDKNSTEVTEGEARVVFREHMHEMISTLLKQKQVFIMEQVPYFKSYNTRKAFYESLQNESGASTPSLPMPQHKFNNDFVHEEFSSLQKYSNVTIINVDNILCAETSGCKFYDNGSILYRDASHLNQAGSRLLTPVFLTVFKTIELQQKL